MARIVVLGGGESGYGSAVLARVKGFDVFLSDSGTIAPAYKTKLEEWEIPYEEGGHTAELILNADLIVKSPGIPDKAPMIRAIRERGIRIVSEIEFAGWYNRARTICITGSNGKTTTTTLTYEILKQGGLNVGLGGNIGASFAYQVATAEHDWYVLELSSFQLDGMFDFRADVAVLMNITPDHLDRYDYQLQNYADSKFRVIQNQGKGQTFIYCDDDPVTLQNLSRHALPMQTFPFSVRHEVVPGAGLENGRIKVTMADKSTFEALVDELKIKGIHNIYNVMAASTAALLAGVAPDSIRQTLRSFAGVEHRLEPAGERNGVLYINDSKATNVDSVWYALESMTRPVVWIVGGTDKGNDYTPLLDFARQKVKALVAMGVDNQKIVKAFSDAVPVLKDTHTFAEAMDEASRLADPGDVVLLSPACASFDLFKNYEDRGKQFKQWVTEHK
ncbi:MAG: UDP-N-acetylmuramoyl-L-alanine--D-glutamate ligase [Rikenellaceae bacterium]|nr:UDP-N-acetylmuramoyl-L-alanine--D-glutamate ligase [Rikenellaceae bacterium]